MYGEDHRIAERRAACQSFGVGKTRELQGETGMVKVTRRMTAAAAALLALGLAVDAAAQEPVKIGIVYPLSGNAASAGNYEKMAMELGADIVNNGNPELAKILPIAK